MPEYISRQIIKYTMIVFELLSKDAEQKSSFISHILHYDGSLDTAMEKLPQYKNPLLLFFFFKSLNSAQKAAEWFPEALKNNYIRHMYSIHIFLHPLYVLFSKQSYGLILMPRVKSTSNPTSNV